MNRNRIFIIGLPRTGTTSVCNAFLELGYKTAHTAYTKQCFNSAEVIADTPVFNDFEVLDKRFPHSKFIYLEREIELWIPSIRQLLQRMFNNLTRLDGGFNPHIKLCYLNTFNNLTIDNIASDAYLEQQYSLHFKKAKRYFEHRPADFLSIDISKNTSFERLCMFLDCEFPQGLSNFEKMNIGGKVTAWNNIKHPLKVASTANGKIDKVIY
ncbi:MULTISPECIES: sulfotransferase [unclassified Pseudoalteromonas]|uniref:sulfotransferase n=1 Tax=unclassified Pseudoalteromonas TaxID=194690 RepID=UPI000C07BE62|nr:MULTISPECIES: sulfotransferase [unclassified Pseudoalteromonas]MDP2634659.1 sulfotransferase [Pseudoalteromonas sp. 1_MG-2023]PHN91194.1 sulfotransferase family protein [Pseudoalteromonas sp. 3D05]